MLTIGFDNHELLLISPAVGNSWKRYEYLGYPQDPGSMHFDHMVVVGDLDAANLPARLIRDGEMVGMAACGRNAETAALSARPRLFCRVHHPDPAA